jgi:hypothetical protein
MDDDQERRGRLLLLAKEQSWRTAWRARSLLSRTNSASALCKCRRARVGGRLHLVLSGCLGPGHRCARLPRGSGRGQVDGDGLNDVVIGPDEALHAGRRENGAAWIVFGEWDAAASTLDAASARLPLRRGVARRLARDVPERSRAGPSSPFNLALLQRA